jgi:hypothetical protein
MQHLDDQGKPGAGGQRVNEGQRSSTGGRGRRRRTGTCPVESSSNLEAIKTRLTRPRRRAGSLHEHAAICTAETPVHPPVGFDPLRLKKSNLPPCRRITRRTVHHHCANALKTAAQIESCHPAATGDRRNCWPLRDTERGRCNGDHFVFT